MNDEDLLTTTNWSYRMGGRILLYEGRHITTNLSDREIRMIVQAKRPWVVLWSYDWDCGIEGPWYSLVCDDPGYEIERISSSSTRTKIRRCLRACDARRITAAELSAHGYETHQAALSRYGRPDEATQSVFERYALGLGERGDCELFGVFYEGALIAYGVVILRGTSVRVSATRFNPAFSSQRPMYGLFYTIAHTYLKSGDHVLVDNGHRPLLHDTNMEEFLRRLGWRKAYARLGLYLRPTLRVVLPLAAPVLMAARRILPASPVNGLLAIREAQRLARLTRPA